MIYPPRPVKAIAPTLIKWYEDQGYIAQIKKNGTCVVISIDGEGKVTWRTRHGEAPKAWTPPDFLIQQFSPFKNCTFVGELLHSKGPDVKDTIYLFDVLQYFGVSQIGRIFVDRQTTLNGVMPISPNVQIARNFAVNLTGLYYSLQHVLDEGIVLKRPNAALRDYARDGLNAGWQVKCRRSTKNYSF